MLRDACESNGLHRAPRAGKQLAYQAAAAIAVSGHFVPVCGAKLGLHRNVKTAHDERHAGFEHDLRRVRVVVNVFSSGYFVSAMATFVSGPVATRRNSPGIRFAAS